VSKQVREYIERTKEVVTTRGTVHDLDRAITHKRISGFISKGISLQRLQGRTKHSEEACDRYIRAFSREVSAQCFTAVTDHVRTTLTDH